MKGILINPGKEPVVTSLPETLQGIEAYLQSTCLMRIFPRTPAVLFFREVDISAQPNRQFRGNVIYGPILCYGWRNNSIQPVGKNLQAELLERLKGWEVKV